MEYADSGSLQNYLKENFNRLTWDDKFKLAYQLACAMLCLHDKGILHCDLVSYCAYFVKLFKIILIIYLIIL
jgi:serine/threonine protein kinase